MSDALIVQEIVQSVSLAIQKEVHDKIGGIVTRCLQAVFDDPYEFEIIFEKKRGKTEARLVFTRDGEEFDPMFECGGGVIDVACLGLRLATLLLNRPAPEPILFLDEPFKNLDKDTPERVVSLLTQLSKEFDIQIVQTTHNDKLITGKVIRL